MKVLLQEDVSSLGKTGEIVNVKEGFARNYLLPRKLAVVADEKNVRVFEHLKRQTEEKIKKQKKSSEVIKDQLSSIVLTIPCKAGEEDKLFGSITSIHVAEELAKKGFSIDRKKIVLEQPLKVLGRHEVKVKLQGDVTAVVVVELVKEQ